jgi:hypothetical protein
MGSRAAFPGLEYTSDMEQNVCDFSSVYTNDTGLDGKTLFTGSERLRVMEVEVFEITE